MRDPFKTNRNKQLVREAQFGFTVIGLLVATLIYVAWFRLSGRHDMTPLHIQDAPVALQVFPNSPNYDRDSHQMVVQDSLTQSKDSPVESRIAASALVQAPKRIMVDSQKTARSLTNMADSVDESVTKVASLLKTPPKLPAEPVGNPAAMGSSDSGFKILKQPDTVLSPKVVAPSFVKAVPELPEVKQPGLAAPKFEPPRLNGSSGFKPLTNQFKPVAAEFKPPATEFKPPATEFKPPAGNFKPLKIESTPEFKQPKVKQPVLSKPDDPAPFTLEPIKPKTDTSTTLPPSPIGKNEQGMAPRLPDLPGQSLANLRIESTKVPGPVDVPDAAGADSFKPFQKSESSKIQVKTVSFESTTWTVKKGDSFWSIAQSNYGDGRFFRALYQQNRRIVPGFEDLNVGVELNVPSEAELVKSFPDLCPADAVHRNDPWRETPGETMNNLTTACECDLDQRLYETKAKDTLFEVARRQLGQASRYVELIDLNRFRIDENVTHETELPAGIQLLLPEK